MFLSIIIPCYNAAQHIKDSVQSVLNQTDSDYEIILVNDGSTDDTLEVLNQLAEQHNCIKVIDKPNGGVSTARNAGINIAQGEYIAFLDSDDVYESTMIAKMKIFTNADMVIFGWKYERGLKKNELYIPFATDVYLDEYLLGKMRICMCSFVVNNSFIKSFDIHFIEGTHFSEDIEFITKCLFYAKHIEICRDSLFTYKWCESSVMHHPEYTEKKITSVYAMERIYNMLKSSKCANSALVAFKLTIILHQRLFWKMNCKNIKLQSILDDYGDKYIKMNTPFAFNKYSAFVWFMSLIYKSQFLYRLLLRK